MNLTHECQQITPHSPLSHVRIDVEFKFIECCSLSALEFVFRFLDRPLDADIMPKIKHVCSSIEIYKMWNVGEYADMCMSGDCDQFSSYIPCALYSVYMQMRIWCEHYRYFWIFERLLKCQKPTQALIFCLFCHRTVSFRFTLPQMTRQICE